MRCYAVALKITMAKRQLQPNQTTIPAACSSDTRFFTDMLFRGIVTPLMQLDGLLHLDRALISKAKAGTKDLFTDKL